jgi:pimeloyl-ACP methyl ester carboxylesterase
MNKNQPIEIDLINESSSLYIFFGGIQAGIAMPPFEFYNSSKIVNENKMFVRDFSQCWYQKGLQGIGTDVSSIADHLKKIINDINPDKIFFVGNSMGGYAAILFAALLGQGEAIAFSPQTFISNEMREIHADNRWLEQIENMHRTPNIIKNNLDLRLLLDEDNKQKISIFVSVEDKLDEAHADHLRDVPYVNIFKFNQGGHSVVKLLRDLGKLPDILSGNYA